MKKTAVFLIAAILTTSVQAAPRSLDAARKIAIQQAQKLGLTVSKVQQARCMKGIASTTEDQPYYVFNNEGQKGWTIVSGDDTLEPVIGYSDEGQISSTDDLPDVVKGILSNYKTPLASTDGESSARALASSTTTNAIGPLMTTKWDQYKPYYNMCPLMDGTNCATCCIVTAFGQILYYLYYTEGGIEESTFQSSLPSYTPTAGIAGEAVAGPRTYRWADMATDYCSTNYTETQASAVATLMRDLGTCLQIKYGSGGVATSTGNSNNVTTIGCGNFGLQTTGLSFVYPTDAASEKSYVDKELNAYRPALVCGNGHCFVCDGRDTQNMYHFNWGYSGRGDGFYSFDALQGYMTSMHMATGLRLQSSISTKQQKVSLTYNSALAQSELEPVGTEPGQYRQDLYDELMVLLDSAKHAIANDCKYLNTITAPQFCRAISSAVQKLTEWRVPYPNGYYYIKCYKSNDSKTKAMYAYSATDNKIYWGTIGIAGKFLWHFEYDSLTNNYKICNKMTSQYICHNVKNGDATMHKDSVNSECEVWPTNLLPGSTTYNVSIRPIFLNYRENNHAYLFPYGAMHGATSGGVTGFEPYTDYAMWVLELKTKDAPTGIDEVSSSDGLSDSVYQGVFNLAGQKLSSPVKGMNIIDGKKVIY